MKSYFATTVEAAMVLARQELGPDAMLVNSRRTSPENRHFGEYEVVFAVMPDESGNTASAGGVDEDRANPNLVEQLAGQIAALKRQIERMSSQFARSRLAAPGARMGQETAHLLAMLLDAEVDEETAGEMAARAAEQGGAATLPEVLGQRIRFDATLGRAGKGRRIVAVVGPPGSGKTTTLVKLAARYGVAGRKPTQILSADCLRIAAADQLRSYAAILGLGFQSVETGHALSVALDEHRHKDLIFIDTPGLSARDMEEGAGLAEVIGRHPEIDVHLIAPASMRGNDLTRALRQYEIFEPDKLLFTKLDETDSPGVLINEAVRTGLPVSYVSTGQQVPEDLEPASAGIMTGLLRRDINGAGIAAGARH
jgi:flagellar biosynthesis protein FlhF